MNNLKNNKYDKKFFENVAPIKLTEGRRVRIHSEGWGLLMDYELESVKITWWKSGIKSYATIRICDRSGQVACAVRGPSIGLLFGMTPQEWMEIEKLCGPGQQLFYRYFKKGLDTQFGFEQKLFYNFCMTNQKTDVLVALFRRCVNMRKKDKGDAFLDIIELRKCNGSMLDLYINFLRQNAETR